MLCDMIGEQVYVGDIVIFSLTAGKLQRGKVAFISPGSKNGVKKLKYSDGFKGRPGHMKVTTDDGRTHRLKLTNHYIGHSRCDRIYKL